MLCTDHILFTTSLPSGQLVNTTLLSFSSLDQINVDHLTQKIGFLSINWSFRVVACLLLFMSHDTVLENVNVVVFQLTGLVIIIHTTHLGVVDGSECLKTAGSIIVSVLVRKNENALKELS